MYGVRPIYLDYVSLSLRSFARQEIFRFGRLHWRPHFSKIQCHAFVQNRLCVKNPGVGCLERNPDEVKIYEANALSSELAGPSSTFF